jgi:hypothetical protein
MLVTDQFVYIHMPKTGGTFVTSVLSHLHALQRPLRRWGDFSPRVAALARRRVAPAPETHQRYGPLLNLEPKHGTYRDIPDTYQRRSVMSTIRNPFDWYVSQYEFRWWTRAFSYETPTEPTPAGFALEQVLPAFMRDTPNFPNASFEDFLELCHRAADIYNRRYGCDLGLYTHGFLRFFYRRPERICAGIERAEISRLAARDMFNISLLRTDRLNEELYEFLLSMGYAADDLRFILGLERVFPMGMGRRDDQGWEKYYTASTKALVRSKDWMIFEKFPEFDV